MRVSGWKFTAVVFLTVMPMLSASGVHPITVDENGGWVLPLRYWAHHRPYEDIGASFVFLAEVTSVGKKPPARPKGPWMGRPGTLKVIERLLPGAGGPPGLDKVKSLRVEGMEGLQLGDRVIVLVDAEFYEGSYVINYHEGSCILGIRLPRKDDLEFGREQQTAFINLIRKNKRIDQLTTEEMHLWLHVDPPGFGFALIREIERERLKWEPKVK